MLDDPQNQAESTASTYEEALTALKKILIEVEQPTTNMDLLAAKVQKANQLVDQCRQQLRGIEKRLDEIL